MFGFIKILFFIYICMGQVSSLIAATVKVFDIGQGNAVAVKHGSRVLIIDVGSSKYTHGAFQQEQASSTKETPFLISKKSKGSPAGDEDDGRPPAKRRKKDQVRHDQAEMASIGAEKDPSSPEDSIPSSSDDDRASKSAEFHRDAVVAGIKEFIWADDTITRIDFIGTHSDKDHVGGNYLREILLKPLLEKFGADFDQLQSLESSKIVEIKTHTPIKNIVLGGIESDYGSSTLPVLDQMKALGIEVIYTGSYDGKGRSYPDFSTPWGTADGYARSYSSFLPQASRSEIEIKIEEILAFGEGLHVDILAMNAGFSQALDHNTRTFIVNPDPNVNSMVLWFTMERGSSFLISGDAEHPTWSFIHGMRAKYKPDQNLDTDYFLVSHHGSKENGATSALLLDLFNPKVLLFSSGAMYNHPSGETMDLIQSHLKKNGLITDLHDITYYRKKDRDVFEYHSV